MNEYIVLTPRYTTYMDYDWELGGGPLMDIRDCIYIEANNKKDAVIFAVKIMLEKGSSDIKFADYQYCCARRSDSLNPYVGVKAYLMPDETHLLPVD